MNLSQDYCRTDLWWTSTDPDGLMASYATSGQWPWENLSPEQWRRLWEESASMNQYNDAVWQFRTLFNLSYLLSAFGILGSICSLITLADREYAKQPSFDYHRAITACDLLYNVLFIMHAWCHLNPEAVERFYALCIGRIVIKGPIFALSLISDLCAVAIAIERMISICYPIPYSKINDHRFAYLLIFLCTLIGFTSRMHFCFLNTITRLDGNQTAYIIKFSAFSQTTMYSAWQAISLMALPFLIIVIVIVLSIFTIRSLVNRYLEKRKRRVADSSFGTTVAGHITGHKSRRASSAPRSPIPSAFDLYEFKRTSLQQNQPPDYQLALEAGRTRSATRLLIATTVLCIFNQVGYIAYDAGWHLYTDFRVCFDSTYPHIENWLYLQAVYANVYFVQGICENVDHMMHFYLYVALSARFRDVFFRRLRALGRSFRKLVRLDASISAAAKVH